MYIRYPLMKKIALFVALISVLVIPTSNLEAAGPRSYGKWGTATTTNSQVTVAFNPAAVCVENKSTSIDLYMDWFDGVATTTDNSTNYRLSPSKVYCFTTGNPSVAGTLVIGLITSSSTADYNIQAVAK